MTARRNLRYHHPLPTLLPDPSKVGDMRRGVRMRELYLWLESYYRNRPDVLVGANGFLCQSADDSTGWVKMDFVVAFDVIPDAIIGRNGYIIDEVGKPPEFLLEVVPEILNDPFVMSGEDMFGEFRPVDVRLDYDYVRKRAAYARYGVGEYWRLCDPVDERQTASLAGWQLADGNYQPLPVQVAEDGELRGYSPRLELNLCWDGKMLRWRRTEGGRDLPGIQERSELLDAALKLWDEEKERRVAAEYREFVANDRIRRLEELLRQQGIEPAIEPSIDEQIEWWRELERRRRGE